MYKKDGQVTNNVGAIITLIVGVGVSALVLIFVGVLGGDVYSEVASDICAQQTNSLASNYCPGGISNGNISASIRLAITSGFEAVETSGQYLPIVVLAVVIFIVLGLVVGMGGGSRSYGGGAL